MTDVTLIKQQNIGIQNKINDIQNYYNVSNQHFLYLSTSRRYVAFIYTFVWWLYLFLHFFLALGFVNSTKSLSYKLTIGFFIIIYPFFSNIVSISLANFFGLSAER
jgi:hypothetical protein